MFTKTPMYQSAHEIWSA